MNQLLITFKAIELHSIQDKAVKAYLERHGTIDRDFAEQIGLECGKIRNLAERIRQCRIIGMRIETDTKTDPANCHYRYELEAKEIEDE